MYLHTYIRASSVLCPFQEVVDLYSWIVEAIRAVSWLLLFISPSCEATHPALSSFSSVFFYFFLLFYFDFFVIPINGGFHLWSPVTPLMSLI